MTAGFDLKEGDYDKCCRSFADLKRTIQPFFENSFKKESSYKYAMFQAIVDSLEFAPPKTHKITFNQLYQRFSEIYWILVFKHGIPQKAPSIKTPKTLAEKIIEDTAERYKISKETEYYLLPKDIQAEIVQQMKRKCSRYVIGALYAETNKVMYSFSKEEEWVKLNPLFADYVKKNKKSIRMNNFQAWARFYADIAAIENKDVAYYQRLLKREFSGYSVGSAFKPDLGNENEQPSKMRFDSAPGVYDVKTERAVRKVLKQHPDLGLYLDQVCEKVESDKETVRGILETAFWSRQEGSRYYYKDISEFDFLEDAIFGEDKNDNEMEEAGEESEIDPGRLRLLNDPEQLIKHLKREKGILRKNAESHRTALSKESPMIHSAPKQRKWEREEVVILVTEYFRTKGLSTKEIEESYRRISEFLRKREEILTGEAVDSTFRNLAGIRLQSSRIQSLDPDSKNRGMKGTRLQTDIVREYLNDSEMLKNEAKRIYEKYKKEIE